MSQINNLSSLFNSGMQENNDVDVVSNIPRQIVPAANSLHSEIQRIRYESLMETMESMSLVMGSRLRNFGGRGFTTTERSGQLQDMLMRWVPKVEGLMLVELVDRFPMLGADDNDPIAQLQLCDVPDGAMVLLLASLLGNPRLEHKRRRRLEDALSRLLEDESIGVDIFGWLEIGAINKNDLLPIRQLMQRVKRDDEELLGGMGGWFAEVKEWPDRNQRLRVLIRAMALDLKPDGNYQSAKIVNAINELKRLLLFFSMEEHCASVAWSVGIPAETMFSEVLLLLEQSWIYPDWIASRMAIMGLTDDISFIWVRRMLELLRFIPSPCFLDDGQCDQLIETFTQLQEQMENG